MTGFEGMCMSQGDRLGLQGPRPMLLGDLM